MIDGVGIGGGRSGLAPSPLLVLLLIASSFDHCEYYMFGVTVHSQGYPLPPFPNSPRVQSTCIVQYMYMYVRDCACMLTVHAVHNMLPLVELGI